MTSIRFDLFYKINQILISINFALKFLIAYVDILILTMTILMIEDNMVKTILIL